MKKRDVGLYIYTMAAVARAGPGARYPRKRPARWAPKRSCPLASEAATVVPSSPGSDPLLGALCPRKRPCQISKIQRKMAFWFINFGIMVYLKISGMKIHCSVLVIIYSKLIENHIKTQKIYKKN